MLKIHASFKSNLRRHRAKAAENRLMPQECSRNLHLRGEGRWHTNSEWRPRLLQRLHARTQCESAGSV